MTQRIVSWDLGATKCTAGLIDYHCATHTLICNKHYTVKLAETHSLEDLINQLETGLNFSFAQADMICIGAAGHYDGQCLIHANSYPYPMQFADTAKWQQWPPFIIIHDYASVICATFTSYMEQEKNIKRLNACTMNPHGRRVALGIGTGLGLKDGVLFANGDFWLGQNEIGHIGIPTPPTADRYYFDRHQAIMNFLNKKFMAFSNQAITFEKILTGQGLVNLYEFFYPDRPSHTTEEIGREIKAGKLLEIQDTFAWYIGLLVGTVQLAFMPEGGVWMTGGVIINQLTILDRSDFFTGIHASPAYLAQRKQYPLGILCDPEHALIGGAYYTVKRNMHVPSKFC
jgi:glucokinase